MLSDGGGGLHTLLSFRQQAAAARRPRRRSFKFFPNLSRSRRNRRPGAVGSATDGRRRRRLHPGACGGAACPACGANHRGLLRWKRPVVQDPAGGFVSAAADRHAFPGRAAGRRDRGRRRRSSRPGDGGAGFDQELIAGPDRPVPGSALEDNPLARNGLPSFDQVLIAAPRTGPRRDGP